MPLPDLNTFAGNPLDRAGDLRNDPNEQRNLAALPAHAARLRAKIANDRPHLPRLRNAELHALAELAREQLVNARRLAADVAKRMQAGDLARSDQHQAEGAVAAAEALAAQAQAASAVAFAHLAALTGASGHGFRVAG